MIVILLAACAIGGDAVEPIRETIKINIRHNNKFYKDYKCQVFKIDGMRVEEI